MWHFNMALESVSGFAFQETLIQGAQLREKTDEH